MIAMSGAGGAFKSKGQGFQFSFDVAARLVADLLREEGQLVGVALEARAPPRKHHRRAAYEEGRRLERLVQLLAREARWDLALAANASDAHLGGDFAPTLSPRPPSEPAS